MIGTVQVAAATAVVNYDLAQNQRWQISSRPRVIRELSIVGGNAINEARIGLYIENTYIGSFFNTRSGVVSALKEDKKDLGAVYVPPASKISLIVEVAPTVSPITAELF